MGITGVTATGLLRLVRWHRHCNDWHYQRDLQRVTAQRYAEIPVLGSSGGGLLRRWERPELNGSGRFLFCDGDRLHQI